MGIGTKCEVRVRQFLQALFLDESLCPARCIVPEDRRSAEKTEWSAPADATGGKPA
jgi:hypothetical protein